jgi:hypothetical protein
VPIHRLSKGGTKDIHAAVEGLFDNLKVRALGPTAVKGKRLYVGFRRDLSLPGIFETAAREEGTRPDLDLLDSLVRVAGNYIDATKERAKAKVANAIDSWLREQSTSKKPASKDDMRAKLREHLDDVLQETTTAIETILDTEATGTRNVSLMDGIIRMNAARGIDDPVVYFIIVRDNVTCDECIRLHLLKDGRTPRVWKLSEVGHAYHKRGDENPKINGLHPHCRCTMVTLLPGFGFKAGSLGFVSPGWDEYAHQHANRVQPWNFRLPSFVSRSSVAAPHALHGVGPNRRICSSSFLSSTVRHPRVRQAYGSFSISGRNPPRSFLRTTTTLIESSPAPRATEP